MAKKVIFSIPFTEDTRGGRREDLSKGSIDSFRTSVSYGFRDTVSVPSQSEINDLDDKKTFIFPVKLYCMEFSENHMAHSSTPQII